MPLDWYNIGIEGQAQAIIDMIDGLTEEDIENTYTEWEQRFYKKGPIGEATALADIQAIATKYMLKRLGKWDNYVENVISRKDKT